MTTITSLEQLREHYPPAMETAIAKELIRLDQHCREFIARSPFVMIASQSRPDNGNPAEGDVSPRGETPGFVQVLDDITLAIPDRPGNNRLDTLTNIVANPAVGLLFLVPGVNETLRINGRAEIRLDPDLLERFPINGKLPRSVVVITVERAYLQCAKALMRSKLWDPASRIQRSDLPSMREWMNAHGQRNDPPEDQADMEKRYGAVLY